PWSSPARAPTAPPPGCRTRGALAQPAPPTPATSPPPAPSPARARTPSSTSPAPPTPPASRPPNAPTAPCPPKTSCSAPTPSPLTRWRAPTCGPSPAGSPSSPAKAAATSASPNPSAWSPPCSTAAPNSSPPPAGRCPPTSPSSATPAPPESTPSRTPSAPSTPPTTRTPPAQRCTAGNAPVSTPGAPPEPPNTPPCCGPLWPPSSPEGSQRQVRRSRFDEAGSTRQVRNRHSGFRLVRLVQQGHELTGIPEPLLPDPRDGDSRSPRIQHHPLQIAADIGDPKRPRDLIHAERVELPPHDPHGHSRQHRGLRPDHRPPIPEGEIPDRRLTQIPLSIGEHGVVEPTRVRPPQQP